MIIQLPSFALMETLLETTGKIEVVYKKFDQKMVKIPEKIKANPVCKYMNTITEPRINVARI